MRLTDIVIIGGGVIGSSVAYHLLVDGFDGTVVVVERDPHYRHASSALAMGGIRQQFAAPVNVRMVQRSLELYERFDEVMAVDGTPAAARFRQRGYLFLVDAPQRDRFAQRLAAMQASGATVERVSVDRIAELAPGVELDDIEFGIFGPKDGYADPRGVLVGFRRKAIALGATYLDDEVIGISRAAGRVDGVVLRTRGHVAAPIVVAAAGAFSRNVGRMARAEIPIDPMRQQLVRCALPRPWPAPFPMVIDPTGTHWRHDDPDHAIVVAKTRPDEPAGERFDTDPDRFERVLLPDLRRRVREFAALRPLETWAGLYEMTLDHNGLVGPHPDLPGFYVAAGFSGHGLMMAPATGKALSEIIRTGQATCVDVSPLAVGRFREGRLVTDEAMI